MVKLKMECSYSLEAPNVPKYTKKITKMIKYLTINMWAEYTPRMDLQDLEKIKVELSHGSEAKEVPEYKETISKS